MSGAARVVWAVALALLVVACRPPAPEAPATTAGPADVAEPRPEAGGESATLRAVRARGRLNCGVHTGLPGFAYRDNRDRWRGFDVDFCRAVAAAVLGDGERVRFRPLTNAERLPALAEGRVDLVVRNLTWTLARDAEGVDFAGVTYFDGQGFLVRRSLGLQSASELNGAAICVQRGTTNPANLDNWAEGVGIDFTPVLVADEAEGRQRLQEEACDALGGDVSALAASRTTLNNPSAFVLLPEVISREPLGPVVREGDSGWRDVVRWTFNSLILAEQLNVTQENAQAAVSGARNPEARRLLADESGTGAALGLEEGWALRAVLAVGNYGEVFERNLGQGSPLRLQRGLNALWNAPQPGLHYPLPLGAAEDSAATPTR